jgi:putative hydrolase of the HAD superfamily
MRKPEFKIYEEVLKEARIKGNETLFIDDNKENVMRAKKIGINAVLHDPKDEIIDIMDHYLSQFNS